MFVKTEGPPTANIMLVGEAPGKEEDRVGIPFQGYCSDSKTEVLTFNGWKSIASVVKDPEPIAQWSTDESIEFTTPTQVHIYSYTGPMIYFSNRSYNQLVTPNHKMVVQTQKGREYLDVLAGNLLKGNIGYTTPLAGYYKTDTSILSPSWARLAAAIQADCTLRANYPLEAKFRKHRKIERFTTLLEACHINFTKYKVSDNYTAFYVSAKEINLIYLLFGEEKTIGSWIFLLSFESLKAFVEEAAYWDASKSINSYVYYTSIKKNAEWLAIAAHLVGWRGAVTKVHPERGDSWVVACSNYRNTKVKTLEREVIKFDGYVYSLTVPSGYHLVKREEHISVTGNSGKTLNLLLNQAGIVRYNCLIANVAREKPPGNKINFYFEDYKCTKPKPIMQEWIELLKREIKDYKPNIVIALGATALWALTGKNSITASRGCITESTLVPGVKVLPTYHPQAVNYEWKLHFPVILDLRKALAHSEYPEIPKDNRHLNSSPSKREFIDFLIHLKETKEIIAVDIETTANAHIDIIGIADSPDHALSFSFLSGNKPRYSSSEEAEIWHHLGGVLQNNSVIMHNAVYDASVLWLHNGILCNHIDDTMIMAHVIWPELPRSLAFMTSICLDVPEWKFLSNQLPTLYNAMDAANTYGIWNVMNEELTKQGLKDIYNFEKSQIEPCILLQLQGILIDKEKKVTFRDDIIERLSNYQTEIDSLAGREVNIGSPTQLKELLYGTLNFEPQFKRRKSITETRKLTTDEEALTKLVRKYPSSPILGKLISAKKLAKVASSFTNFEVSPEGRVHTSYNITGATMQREKKGLVFDDEDSYRSFGRWSSSKSIILPYGSGNLQNIPKEVRRLYIPEEGKVFIQADYIQAEAVIVAYLSGDNQLKEMFKKSFGASREERDKNGWDVHKIKAAQLFGIPVSEVTPEQRGVGKTLRHAVNYSAGPAVLMNKLNIAMKEAKELLQRDRDTNPHLELWHRAIQEELRETRTLTNLLGRRHRFLDRWPKPGEEFSSHLFRSAYSFKPQSTVGDLLNLSLVKLYEQSGEDIDITLQLHDAIYCITSEDELDRDIKVMRENMLHELSYKGESFTIDVDFSVGKNWGEMEEI